jgi:uncharacterized protein (UPF0332 family)
MNIDKCLKEGYLIKIKSNQKDLIKKEMKEAQYDLEKAKESFEEEDFKWCIVKAYYSMFHISKALLFKLGYKEKKHFAVGIVLEELNKDGKLEIEYVNNFKAALSSREDADYHYIYSKDNAKYILESTEEFIDRILRLIRILK